jgi:hypothetical protein
MQKIYYLSRRILIFYLNGGSYGKIISGGNCPDFPSEVSPNL